MSMDYEVFKTVPVAVRDIDLQFASFYCTQETGQRSKTNMFVSQIERALLSKIIASGFQYMISSHCFYCNNFVPRITR